MATQPLASNGSVHGRAAAALSPGIRALSELQAQAFLRGLPGLLLLLGCLLFVGLVTLLHSWAGPEFSFALLYLGPVAWGAWRGGFALGCLVAVASVAAWHAGDALQGGPHPAIGLLNGVIRFGLFVFTASLLSRLRLSMLHEKALARTDPLTGAANGRTFYEEIYRAAERNLRDIRPLSLAYLDLDNFKLLNDGHGHAAGDAALCHVAATIRHHIRVSDTLARLGGDEFALLLPETDGPQAAIVLDRLHRLLCQEFADRGWPISVSIGAVTFDRPTTDIDVMVGRADSLMYLAKSKGKARLEHRVVLSPGRGAPAPAEKVERRAAARVLCGRLARIQAEEGCDPRDEFATVQDVSDSGVGLHMSRRLAPGTLVTVEPLHACGAKALLARVAWSAAEGGGWAHGCTLSARLTPLELRAWAEEQQEAAAAPASASP